MAPPAESRPLAARLKGAAAVFRQVPPTFGLLREASLTGAISIGLLTAVGAFLPAAIAWVGKLIVDGVVLASRTGDPEAQARVVQYVFLELALMTASTSVTRLQGLFRAVTGAKLANHIGQKILEKALTLELRHFEDSEVYDKMQNARREAGFRPLNLAMEGFAIVQSVVTLATFAFLLVRLSPWSVVILIAASLPAFIAEARFAGESFRMTSWRAPEFRRLNYLEWILTRDSHVKEVKLFDLGPLVLGRYRTLFSKFYDEDRRLAVKRMAWGLALGLFSLLAFYGIYAWIAGRAAAAQISLGDMTLYLYVFRQGQQAFQSILGSVGSMYEDSLFMSNLFAFFGIETGGERARRSPALSPPRSRDQRIELRNVSFRYPMKDQWALRDVSLTIEPNEKLALVGENGAGKSTLVKLLMRLYDPTEGEILWGGVDLRDMDPKDLRSRIGAVFQDAVRYQFSVAENIALGDPSKLEDRAHVERAAEQGGAVELIESLPQKWETVLGGWFERGQELSGGQWQKIAVSRAFMRDADVLILDEPSASIDAEAEYALFQRMKRLTEGRIAIVISHRFSTVRIADRIAVLHDGKIEEIGTHEALVAKKGRYSHLFELQALGYR